MPTSTPSPAGWYRDPEDPRRHRFWDGQRWTKQFPARDSAGGRSTTTEDANRPSGELRPPSQRSPR